MPTTLAVFDGAGNFLYNEPFAPNIVLPDDNSASFAIVWNIVLTQEQIAEVSANIVSEFISIREVVTEVENTLLLFAPNPAGLQAFGLRFNGTSVLAPFNLSIVKQS